MEQSEKKQLDKDLYGSRLGSVNLSGGYLSHKKTCQNGLDTIGILVLGAQSSPTHLFLLFQAGYFLL